MRRRRRKRRCEIRPLTSRRWPIGLMMIYTLRSSELNLTSASLRGWTYSSNSRHKVSIQISGSFRSNFEGSGEILQVCTQCLSKKRDMATYKEILIRDPNGDPIHRQLQKRSAERSKYFPLDSGLYCCGHR